MGGNGGVFGEGKGGGWTFEGFLLYKAQERVTPHMSPLHHELPCSITVLLFKTCREENHRPLLFFLRAKLPTVVLQQRDEFY